MSQQIQLTGGAKVRDLQDVIIGTSGVLSSVAFDVSNGVPRLDVNGKILVSQLPNSVMEYKGTWNAATNTPTLANGTGNQGDVYLCNVAGTVNFGAGAIAFFVGDQVIYSGSIWQRASGATGTVTSVAVTETGDSLNITGSPITTSGTINIGFNGTNLQYVNGAGNLTTFPILTGYVPYTGATQDVDLGAFSLNGKSLHIKGTAGNGHLGLKHQSAAATGSANESLIYADTLGDLSWQNANLYLSKFITSANSANRSYTFPNATCNIPDDSLVVHLAGTETITGAKTFSGYTTFTSTVDITSGLTFSNSGFTLVLQPPTLSVNRTVTLPNGTGTLALTSDLTGYLTAVTATSPLSSSGGTTPNITIAQATTSANGYLSSTDWNTFNNKQATITLTTTGTSGAATLIGATLNIPNYAPDLSGYVTLAGTQTITGAKTFSTYSKFDGGVILKNNVSASLAGYVGLSAYSASGNKGINIDFDTYSASFYFSGTLPYQYTFPAATGTIALVGGSGVGTVTSVAALTLGTTGTDLSSSVANSTTTPVITLNVPTASATNRGALSSADWTTFNNKQATITLTTTGTSGAATLVSNTLNIPNYTLSGLGGIGGTGTTNYLPKFTGASTIGDSAIYESGGLVGIGTNNPLLNLQINSASGSNSTLAFSENNALKWYTRYNAGDGSFSFVDVVNTATRLIITNTGNLGLGVTPSAWGTITKAIQIGNRASLFTYNNVTTDIGNNLYFNGTNYIYLENDYSTFLRQNTGQFQWLIAPSGTAGAAITFTQAMTLNASGNLGIGSGATSPTQRLTVSGSTGDILGITNGTATGYGYVDNNGFGLFTGAAASGSGIYYRTSNIIDHYISGSIAVRLASTGNLLVNTTTDSGYKLDVNGTGRFSGSVYSSGSLQVAPTTGTGMIGVGDNFGGNMNAGIYRGGLGVTTSGNYLNIGGYDGVVVTTGNAALGSQTVRLTIASTGAATFSSSVTAGGTISASDYIQAARSSGGYLMGISNTVDADLQFILTASGAGTKYASIGGSGATNLVLAKNGGNVGIGITNPGAKLQVKTSTSAGATDAFYIENTSAALFEVRDDGLIYMKGNVGIGTNSPQLKFVVSNGGAAGFEVNPVGGGSGVDILSYNRSTSAYTQLTIDGSLLAFNTSATERMRITSGGDLYVKGNGSDITLSTRIYSDDTYSDFLASATSATAKTMRFFAKNTLETMRITSGGQVSIGPSGTVYGTNLLNVNGGIYATSSIAAVVAADIDMLAFVNTGATYSKACVVASMTATGGTGSYFFYGQQSTSTAAIKIFSNGNIQNTNNSYGAISDARLKENIKDATPKLDDLMKVKVRNYNLKGESNKQLGVISQELEAIFPNMIEESTNMGENMKIKGVKYSVFVPMLIKAVQEQQQQINELKQLINK